MGKPTALTIRNEDATAEEFESSALKVEKVIVGGTVATVWLRPLGPGRYPFMGEYHRVLSARTNKTDRNDALRLAELMRVGWYRAAWRVGQLYPQPAASPPASNANPAHA